MFLGYWNAQETTAAKFAGEWLLTGDLGVVEKEGFIRFIGRADDLITSGGYRIGPAEIEDCLSRHPAVLAAAALALGVTGAGSTAAAANAATAATASPTVTWQPCPQYSDAVLDYLRVRPQDYAAFRAIWARTQCGTVSVPLDYRHPDGQHITIAFTRLPAQDQAHRLGSVAMNPGGPGGSGYLMPLTLTLETTMGTPLNQHYDLIGFDPRGIGYSTSYDCPPSGSSTPVTPPVGQWTKAGLKQFYDSLAAQHAACSSSNPAFLSQLTTANVARDLDQIRRALHQKQMDYFGASWGTQLGAVYRSMFSNTIGRMWLDSVVSPNAHNLAYRFDYTGKTTEQDFALFAQWLAARDSTYGLGDTAAKVRATVLGLRQAADAHPWQFSDIAMPLDGSFISFLASASNLNWALAGQILQALTTAVDGGPAPAVVKEVVGSPSIPPAPPADAPAQFNDTAGQAYLCNEDTSSRSFESWWAEYQRNLRANPVTGDLTALRPTCAGWTLPVQTFQLHRSSGSLQMSGHLYETLTPYPWVLQMQDAIGGTVFTVEDFIHGSLPFVPECAAHLVAYFDTGDADNGTCQGLQPDSESTATAATTATSTATIASAPATASVSTAASANSAISGASSLSWPKG